MDRANLLRLTASEMMVLIGGMRALNANFGQYNMACSRATREVDQRLLREPRPVAVPSVKPPGKPSAGGRFGGETRESARHGCEQGSRVRAVGRPARGRRGKAFRRRAISPLPRRAALGSERRRGRLAVGGDAGRAYLGAAVPPLAACAGRRHLVDFRRRHRRWRDAVARGGPRDGEEIGDRRPRGTVTAGLEVPCPNGCGWSYTTFAVRVGPAGEVTCRASASPRARGVGDGRAGVGACRPSGRPSWPAPGTASRLAGAAPSHPRENQVWRVAVFAIRSSFRGRTVSGSRREIPRPVRARIPDPNGLGDCSR